LIWIDGGDLGEAGDVILSHADSSPVIAFTGVEELASFLGVNGIRFVLDDEEAEDIFAELGEGIGGILEFFVNGFDFLFGHSRRGGLVSNRLSGTNRK
jgi:hypothetical protein